MRLTESNPLQRPLEREDSQLDSHFDLSKWGAILKEHGGSVSAAPSQLPPSLKLQNQTSGPQSYAEVGSWKWFEMHEMNFSTVPSKHI